MSSISLNTNISVSQVDNTKTSVKPQSEVKQETTKVAVTTDNVQNSEIKRGIVPTLKGAGVGLLAGVAAGALTGAVVSGGRVKAGVEIGVAVALIPSLISGAITSNMTDNKLKGAAIGAGVGATLGVASVVLLSGGSGLKVAPLGLLLAGTGAASGLAASLVAQRK